MKEDLYDDLLNEKEEKTDFQALFFKYIIHWPWFVASVLICTGLAFAYLRYQIPVYEVSSSILIKEDDKKSTNNALSAMQDFGMLSMTSNFDNELEILKSRTLIKKVVSRLNLYTNIAIEQSFGYDVPLYKNSPLDVFMTAEEADKLEGNIRLELIYSPTGQLTVTAFYIQNGDKQETTKSFDELPAILPLPVGVITISHNDSLPAPQEPVNLKAIISTPTAAAAGYRAGLTVAPISNTSTIATISVQNTHIQRASDFTQELIILYNQDTNTEKNEVAQKSADFIEERISIINHELGTTETELAEFKQRAGLTDISSDAQLALQESSKYEQQYAENATQINLVNYLRDYINNPANNDEIIPANVGLSDMNLTSAIDKYNNLIVERKRLLRTSSESNPAIINLNTGIEAMRHNVKTTVNSVLKGLQITRSNIDRQSRKYESRISNAPKQEQEFMSIARQQEIKATLYIMLLQKREENAITLAATANNGRIIEEPMPAGIVSPQGKKIYMITFVIGIGIPLGIIFLLNLLRFRIEGHTDVEKLTKVPIIGDIPLTGSNKHEESAIAVRENDNDIMTETFRSLRTNLLFMMGDPDKKVILVTSTISGEGKTFIASNLALSLALLGKKVILVGLDIRKPGLNKLFHLSHKEKGITQYLVAPKSTDLHALIQPSGITSNLDLLLGGPIPPNPTELLARQSLEDTISTLRKEYDYIVLDTAPIGIGIPLGIIFLLNLLRFRIEGHTDVEKLTKVPIIGDIPLTGSNKHEESAIAVRENDNDIMTETFRSLRTNLLFMMGDPDKKVILVTSTISGEGKTFIASNLALSLALLGKKVILVGLDIRKPGLNKLFHLSHKEKGITQYLVAPKSTDLHALIQPSGITSNLDLLLGGPIPPNPTELLARQSLEDTISTLRKEYDYIVLDTAPIGMVTDTLILSRVADASIYVCRADYTHKTDYQLINELQEHHRLPNLCTVVNGIDMKKKKYGYYYGYGKYGKYYGYGKKYGYS